MDRALFHCGNAYTVPNMRVRGHVCRTNIPSNTAFRGFGGPQAMMIAEHYMMDVAETLGISPVKVNIFKYHFPVKTNMLKHQSQQCCLLLSSA